MMKVSLCPAGQAGPQQFLKERYLSALKTALVVWIKYSDGQLVLSHSFKRAVDSGAA